MEREQPLSVRALRPFDNRPILGPSVIPVVSAPAPVGTYMSEADRFRHIDSSSASTFIESHKARLARTESFEDERTGPEEERPAPDRSQDEVESAGRPEEPSPDRQVQESGRERAVRRSRCRSLICPLILGLLLGLALLAIIGIVVAWAVTSDGFRRLGGISDVCATKECIELAAIVTESLEPNIAICDNFYRHTCGQFHFGHATTPNIQYDYRRRLDEGLESKLNEIFSRPQTSNITSFSYRFSKALFSQCLDFPLRESVGTAPLLALLRDLPCGPLLPTCTGFNEKYFSWERNAGMMDYYAGPMNLILIGRSANPQSQGEVVLSFDTPDLSALVTPALERVRSLRPQSDSELQALLSVQLKSTIINDTFVTLLGVRWSKDLGADFDELTQLVVQIDELTRTARQSSPEPQVMALQDFSNLVNPIDVKALLDASLSANHAWSWTDAVVIQNAAYYQGLAQIAASTSKRALANYLTLVTVVNLKPLLHLNGQQEDWRLCLKQMSILDPVANVYSTNVPMNYGQIGAFFEELRAFFVVTNTQWNPATLDTLRRADIKIGVPTVVVDDDAQSRIFGDVQIREDSFEQRIISNAVPWTPTEDSDYFNSFVASAKRQRASEFSRIGNPAQSGDSANWPALGTDFVYNALSNEMIIPLGLFQTPPLALPNSAAPIASVLATTGFLFFSFLIEVANKLQPNTPILPCADQVYQGFSVPNNLHGAENTWMAVQYLSALESTRERYQDWKIRKGIGREQALPVLSSYSDEQLIYLQFGVLMCSTQAGSQENAPYEAMINSAVSMSPDFAHVFQCSPEARMSKPSHTCAYQRPSTRVFMESTSRPIIPGQ